MATRYRFEALSPEDKQTLKDIIGNSNLQSAQGQAYLDSFDQGIIPEQLINQFGPNGGAMVEKMRGIVSRMPDINEAKKLYIKNNLNDNPNLSDSQLTEKQGILTDLSKVPATSQGSNLEDYFTRQLQAKFRQFGSGMEKINPEAIKDISKYVVNSLKNGNYDPQNVVNRIVSTTGEGRNSEGVKNAFVIANDIPKDYTREVQTGQYTESSAPVDYSVDQKAVGDIINDRGVKAGLDKQYQDFANSAPGELANERARFTEAQRVRAKDFITGEYAPQVAERLAAMGLGDSGQVASSIGTKYADLMGGIDSSAIQQLQDDQAFFANQAYQKTFADLIAARADLSSTIGTERNKLVTEQKRGFSNREADITNKFNLDLFRQQSQAAFNNYQRQVTKQRQVAQDAQNAQTVNTGANAVGQVAGIAIGSMA